MTENLFRPVPEQFADALAVYSIATPSLHCLNQSK